MKKVSVEGSLYWLDSAMRQAMIGKEAGYRRDDAAPLRATQHDNKLGLLTRHALILAHSRIPHATAPA